jgi:hypothetical protein
VNENFDESSVQLRDDTRVPKNIQLELLATVSVDRVDQKRHRGYAIKMCEIDNGVAAAKYILQGMAIPSGQDLCVTNALKKQLPVELQMELCARSG